MRTVFALLDKELAPVFGAVGILIITDTDFGEISVHNVGAVSRTVHPCGYDFLWGALTPCNILTGATVGDILLLQGSGKAAAIGAGMRKGGLDFNSAHLRGCLYTGVHGQRGKPFFGALGVHQFYHLSRVRQSLGSGSAAVR